MKMFAVGTITNILIDFVRGICALFGNLAKLLIYLIDLVFNTADFSPSTEFLKTKIMNPQTNTYENVMQLFKYFGFFAGAILFVFGFIMLCLAGIKEMKDSVSTILKRFILFILVITFSTQILEICSETVYSAYENMEWVLNNGNSSGEDFLDPTRNNGMAIMDDIKNSLSEDEEPDDPNATPPTNEERFEEVLELLGVTIPQYVTVVTFGTVLVPILAIAAAIINLALMGFILFFYVKLVIELIRRYVSYCFLHMSFPAVCGFLASAYTENIFWTYLRSYLSEAICLMLTHFFMYFTKYLLAHLGIGIVSTFVVISWINLGISLDQFLKDHGFAISAVGGNLLEGIISSGARMAMIGSATSHSLGNGIIGAAALTHSVGTAKLGNSLLGKGMSDAAALNSMGNSFVGSVEKAMKSTGGGRGLASISNSETAAMVRMFKNGSRDAMQSFGSRLNTLNSADRNNVLGTIRGNVINGANGKLNMSSTGFASKFGTSAANNMKITGVDGRGNLIGTIDGALGNRQFTLGTNAINSSSVAFESADGNDMYMTLGEMKPNRLDNGISFENFTNGMDVDSLYQSELSYMSKLQPENLQEFQAHIKEQFEFDDYVVPSDASEWNYMRTMDGSEVASYKTGSYIYQYEVDNKGQESYSEELLSENGSTKHKARSLDKFKKAIYEEE